MIGFISKTDSGLKISDCLKILFSGQSRRLITKYARREVTDRVLILFAVAFYFAVVLYILRKRVFGPLDPVAIVWSTVKTLVIALVKIIQTVQKAIIDAFA